MANDNFRFRIIKAPGGEYSTVDAFKASPAYASIQTLLAGKPEASGTIHVSYKLYEGGVWIRYDFDNEEARLAYKQYVLDAGSDLGQKPNEVGLDNETFPTYGFLA